MPAPPVGIDIVDLDDRRLRGKGVDARFTARVLAPEERAFVAASGNPDLALWAHWAAKEAAFKVVTGLAGRAPVFRHALFRARIPRLPGDGGGLVQGSVAFEGRELPVMIQLREGCVVALSSDPAARLPLSGVRWNLGRLDRLARQLGVAGRSLDDLRTSVFRAEEARPIHSLASALVRLAARRDAALLLECDEGELTVVCAEGPAGRMPPVLRRGGGPAPDLGVSLSHHGRWAAWALARRAASGQDGPVA